MVQGQGIGGSSGGWMISTRIHEGMVDGSALIPIDANL